MINRTKNILIYISCIVLFATCDNEQSKTDEVTLLSNNAFKAWEVTDVTSANEDVEVEKCREDDIWEFVQEGWKYVNWKLEIKPGFLKCSLDELSTHWNWEFNNNFNQLYLTSIDDPENNFVIKFDIIKLEENEMVLQQKTEDPFGLNFNRYTITLKSRN